jgi:hypothetical protein
MYQIGLLKTQTGDRHLTSCGAGGVVKLSYRRFNQLLFLKCSTGSDWLAFRSPIFQIHQQSLNRRTTGSVKSAEYRL